MLWILAVQFFIAQAIVQSAWTAPFSLATNYISDLGNTVCSYYPVESRNYVCSPWHGLMNLSFILLGVTKIAGAVLIRGAFPATRQATVGLGLVALSGLGVILVGLFSENVNGDWHRAGAGIDLVSGNIGIALLGAAQWYRGGSSAFAVYSMLSGMVGLTALWLFVAERDLGLGIGGMERLAAYPIPLWMIVAGCYILRRVKTQSPVSIELNG